MDLAAVFAATPLGPSVPPPEVVAPFDPVIPIAVGIGLVLLAVTRRWPSTRRPLAAVAILVIAALVAATLAIAGSFTRWRDDSVDLPMLYGITGLVILGLGIVASILVLFGGRRRPA